MFFSYKYIIKSILTNKVYFLYPGRLEGSINKGSDIDGLGLSPKREIEYFWGDLHSKLFCKLIESKTGEEKENEIVRARRKMQEFNVTYSLVESKFSEKYGKEYKKHFKKVQDIIQTFIGNINLEENIEEGSNELDKLINILLGILIEEKLISEHSIEIIYGEGKYSLIEQVQIPIEKRFKPEYDAPTIGKQTKLRVNGLINSYDYLIGGRGLTKVRAIENLRNEVYEKLYREKVENGKITIEEVERELLKINQAYALAKWKFQEIYRKSGSRYFEHLRDVAYNVLNYDPHANLDKVLIAILHDIIEDTDIDYQTLEDLFGYKIAIAVQAISKPSISKYIYESNNAKDIKEFQEIRNKSNILNSKGEIKSSIKKKCELGKCSKEELGYIDRFKKLKKKYKKARNKEYFGHLESISEFEDLIADYLIKVFNGFGIERKNDIYEIAENSLIVKFMDRIHNMKTIWDFGNQKAIFRKCSETIRHFYKILKQFYKQKPKYDDCEEKFGELLMNLILEIVVRNTCNICGEEMKHITLS